MSSLSFKAANLDQLWSCLQRCLLFEEPSSRWTKLMSQVARLSSGKSRDLSQLPFSEQQEHFRTVFGTPEDLLEPSARAFNLILAAQDLKHFEAADFDIWFFSQENDSELLDCPDEFHSIAEAILQTKPSQSQAVSLFHAWSTVPYWRVLESYGPWAEEPLAEFVASILRKLDKMNPDCSPSSMLAIDARFSEKLREARSRLPGNFQPSLLVLVEGSTEAILLPKFLGLSGRTSDGAAMFVSCGGANQLLRKYLHLRDLTRLPILCVMDHDAVEQIETIKDVMREQDNLHIWSVGEIEDTFPRDAILDSLNAYLQILGSADLLLPEDLSKSARRTELLDRLWRSRGLGDFDKVGFAEFQASRLKHSSEIPAEGRLLMNTIKEMSAGKHVG